MATLKQTNDGAALPVRANRPERLNFEEVARDHGKQLLARALWLTRDQSQARDLFQTTFERALRSPRRIAPGMALRWMLTIMHNAFLDDRRAAWTRGRARESEKTLGQTVSDPLTSETFARWRLVEDEAVNACVRRLSPDHQTIYSMQLAGLSYGEVAKRLSIPQNTVGTRVLRLRRRLRAMLR